MKFQTLSLVAGTKACNAKCPFCVSRLTGLGYVDTKPEEINSRNLQKALRLAEIGDTSTVIITGKGEPLLYPEHISTYMDALSNFGFPLIELQTNAGILENDTYKDYNIDELLETWYKNGLTTILISNVGPSDELNRLIYFPNREKALDMEKIVKRIHKHGLNVRLTTVGIKLGVSNPYRLQELIGWAATLGVKQVTWRPVNKPSGETQDTAAYEWVKSNGLDVIDVDAIREYVIRNGSLLYKLVHGAAVYDLHGSNFCMTNCLTHNPVEETIRQLIFYPNGGLYTDWEYKGSVIL